MQSILTCSKMYNCTQIVNAWEGSKGTANVLKYGKSPNAYILRTCATRSCGAKTPSEVWCGDKGCRPEKWFLIPGREEKGRFYLTAHPALLDKEDEWWCDAGLGARRPGVERVTGCCPWGDRWVATMQRSLLVLVPKAHDQDRR